LKRKMTLKRTLLKNRFKKISLISTLLLLSLAFNTFLVQADTQGIGKYLTIDVVGQGYVTATKVRSGEVFTFDQTTTQHKVGAGTVLLNAVALDGWEFVEWTGDYLASTENPVEFKTVKYATITAVFREKIYTITASSSSGGSIDPDGDVQVKHGDNQAFAFNADTNFHVSSILVDGAYLTSFSNGYTFFNVVADHSIHVSFSEEGTATVPAGDDVSVFLGEGAGITFGSTSGGVTTGELEDFPEGSSIIVWELNYTFAFAGGAQVALQYDDAGLTLDQEQNLLLIRGDSLVALYSDVDGDLDVDGTDVSIIANAVNTNTQPDWYDPLLDVNNDGEVDSDDIHLVNANKGALLEDITDWVDTDLNIIYGTTDQFSIFRCR
jgi:hypothetical protein